MPTVRLILMCSRFSVLTISLGGKEDTSYWVTSSSEIPREVFLALRCYVACSFPAIFTTSLPSSHSLRFNGKPVVVEKVSTLHLSMLLLPPKESFKRGFSKSLHAGGRRMKLWGRLRSSMRPCCVSMMLRSPLNACHENLTKSQLP